MQSVLKQSPETEMERLELAPLTLTPRYQATSAWWEHVPIAHWLIARLQPRSVVELGSYYGVSFFAFCEAAQAFSPETFTYAIDSWGGDEHTGHYGEEVYAKVHAEQQRQHLERSRLIRSSFDAAADHFADASIDLLHIDGLHTYQAVKHDLNTWLPKLHPDGTVLFHDTNVREGEFGVWQLWQELQNDGRFHTLEMRNGHGLGIASLGSQVPGWHQEFTQLAPLMRHQGALLDALAQLKPESTWGETDWLPYAEQARTAKAEVARCHSELHNLQGELHRLQNETIGLHSSSSWTLTKPLCLLSRLLRR